MKDIGEQLEMIFDQEYDLGSMGKIIHSKRYRVRTIKSGNVIELELYPLWDCKNEFREIRSHATRAAQDRLNRNNSIKKCIRLANCNFVNNGSLHVTLTYDPDLRLPDEVQAKRDVKNYLTRCTRFIRKNNPRAKLKYIYVTEHYSGDGRRTRVHHHIILNGIDRDNAERLWLYGTVNADRIKSDDDSIEGLVRYILKSPSSKNEKKWVSSRGLTKPRITTADTKISKRQVDAICEEIDEHPQIFTRWHKNHVVDDCTVRTSEYVSGAYIYAKLLPQRKANKRIAERRRC
ncbi:MAG: hypothetical protein LBN22_11600 [Clostridiales Family XIII bacterium]|nr:hypothetical protein [Clostridiales Family XIII bacterium]